MKFAKYILPVFIAVSIIGCNAQTAEPKAEQAQSEVINKDVDVAEFAELITKNNGVLIDVRTDDEFAQGRIKGARQINIYNANFSEQLDELDPNTPVYVYCRSGGRSGRAAKMLKEKGFAEVYNLEGGITAWQRENQPIEK